MHSTLSTDGRVLVVGDVHGCATELEALLTKCGYSRERDTVVLVGDLLNKGPASAAVVRMAVDGGFVAVLGNHDVIGLSRYDAWRTTGTIPPADKHGSYEYLSELRDADVEWLRRLPLSMTLPCHDALVVHAGLVPVLPLCDQHDEDLYSIRNLSADGQRALYDTAEGRPWAEAWDALAGTKPFILFGHDAPRGLQQWQHSLGLDTNCCNGGRLTACILPGRELVSVDGLGQLHLVGAGPVREWRQYSRRI